MIRLSVQTHQLLIVDTHYRWEIQISFIKLGVLYFRPRCLTIIKIVHTRIYRYMYEIDNLWHTVV